MLSGSNLWFRWTRNYPLWGPLHSGTNLAGSGGVYAPTLYTSYGVCPILAGSEANPICKGVSDSLFHRPPSVFHKNLAGSGGVYAPTLYTSYGVCPILAGSEANPICKRFLPAGRLALGRSSCEAIGLPQNEPPVKLVMGSPALWHEPLVPLNP